MRIEVAIQNKAQKLGFAAAGFARVGPSRTFERFQDWIARGFAAQMTYLSKNAVLRADPRNVATEAQSVIVVAARYLSGTNSSFFSNYVQGRDYHDIIRAKLKVLGQFIRQRVKTPLTARICADSAPVLEREWAERAGVGWIGRQGSIIHPEFGACLFLGELFVNIELEPSLPLKNQCADCRLCLNACPTGAIQSNGHLDARRCISYLTVEHKGMIPHELWSLIGSSLFGCDRCTAICPWNQYGAEAVMPEFCESNQKLPSSEECLAMSEQDFDRRFSGTSVYRAGLEQLQRNAVVVLANKKNKSCLKMLEMSLKSSYSLVRKHAAIAVRSA